MQERKEEKKVSFADDKVKDDRRYTRSAKDREDAFRIEIGEEVKRIRKDKVDLEILKVEVNAKLEEMSEKIKWLENRFLEWEDKALRTASVYSEGSCERDGATGSVWSLASGGSGLSASALSARSGVSAASAVSMTERDIVRMKKLLAEKERNERQNNIVIRGLNANGEDLKEFVESFIKLDLGIDIEVDSAWGKGRIIIAKIKGNGKAEVIKNKNKLGQRQIFIENDLPVEDRIRQSEIRNWIKGKKEEGWNLKAGFNRVLFKGTWRKWEEKEAIEKEMEETRQRKSNNNVNENIQNEKSREVANFTDKNFV